MFTLRNQQSYEAAQRAYDAASVHDDDTEPPKAPPPVVCECCGAGHDTDACTVPLCEACDGSGACWVCAGERARMVEKTGGCGACNNARKCTVCGGTGVSVNRGCGR